MLFNLSQLQNFILSQIRTFFAGFRFYHPSPTLYQLRRCAEKPNRQKNHRIWLPKRVLRPTLALIPLLGMPGFHEPWGKDTDLHHPSLDQKELHLSPLAKAMKSVIWFHQNVISPVDGPRSHFKPSSSNYMLQAINKHGFFKGYIMGCDRLLRENKESWVYRTALIDGKIWKVDFPE